MSEHETIADIIAEMRKDKGVDPNLMWDNSQVEEHDLHYADRFEAAHRRERGNAAKLREALQSCLDTICRIVWIDDPEYDEDGHYLGANYAAVSRDKARAALSAPPRNCDVYNNESCRMAYHLHGDGLMTMQAFADWLFAPATEKEGGNDGNK